VARGGPAAIQVEGLSTLRRAFKNSEADVKDLTGVHRTVARKARADVLGAARVAKKTGRLERTYRYSATQAGAALIAGRGPASEYWGVIEFAKHGRYRGLVRRYGPAPRGYGRIGQPGYAPGGRFFYPTLHKNRDQYIDEFWKHLDQTLRRNFGR